MWDWLFRTEGFTSRIVDGGAWTRELIWTSILSNVMLAVAFVGVTIMSYLRYRLRLPLTRLGLTLCASWLLLSATVFLMNAVLFFWPVYNLNVALRVLTAACAIATISWMISTLRHE